MKRPATGIWKLVFFLSLLAALILPSALLAAPASAGPWVPEPVTEQARAIADLETIVYIIAVIIFILVEGAILYMLVRYRKRDDSVPQQTHGNVPIEIVWTAIPLVIVLVLFALSWRTLSDVQAKPDPDLTVNVQGFQFQWRFTYPDQNVSVIGTPNNLPEMVLPVDKNIRINLNSNDVIHSFYVPQFLYKLDVIPGRDNNFTVKLDEEGTFHGQCAEFCGLGHADMTFRVRGVSQEEFDQWVSEQRRAAATPAATPAGPAAETLEIAAKNVRFDKTTLEVSANVPFAIEFDNQDAGVPHNVAIYTDRTTSQSLFVGDIFPGPATRTYQVPALQAGSYFFKCDVHPTQMTGTLNVR